MLQISDHESIPFILSTVPAMAVLLLLIASEVESTWRTVRPASIETEERFFARSVKDDETNG